VTKKFWTALISALLVGQMDFNHSQGSVDGRTLFNTGRPTADKRAAEKVLMIHSGQTQKPTSLPVFQRLEV